MDLKILILIIFVILIVSVAGDAASNENSFSVFNWLADKIGDFIMGVVSLSEGITEVLDCDYKCEDLDKQPSRNSTYISTFNGCGSRIKLPDFLIPKIIEDCCNNHDKCYGTCNYLKEWCDDEFQNCLDAACTTNCSLLNYGYDLLFPWIVVLAGCSEYLNGQENACECL